MLINQIETICSYLWVTMAYSDSTALETAVYLSSATLEMTPPHLYSILAKARDNNRANGVTGVLLYAEGSFLQVLEGSGAALDATLGRISKDSRHGGMMVIYRDIIAERAFAGWTLGFRCGEADESVADVFALSREKIDDYGDRAGEEIHCLLMQFYASAYPHLVS